MNDAGSMLQEQVLDSVRTAQDATLKIARGWAKFMASAPISPELPPFPTPEAVYSFGERLWHAEKDFVTALFEVATEAGKSLPGTLKRVASPAHARGSAAYPGTPPPTAGA